MRSGLTNPTESNRFTIGELHRESGDIQVEDEAVDDLAGMMIAGADEDSITREMDEADMAESDETSETPVGEMDEAGITVSESDETGTTAAGETDEAGITVAE